MPIGKERRILLRGVESETAPYKLDLTPVKLPKMSWQIELRPDKLQPRDDAYPSYECNNINYESSGYLPRIASQNTAMAHDVNITTPRRYPNLNPHYEQPATKRFYGETDEDFGAGYPCDSARGYNDGTSRSHWHRSVVVQGESEARVRRHYKEPSDPILRLGRLGGPWRHIRQVTGNLGNHICFVDGEVKKDDSERYPPFGLQSSIYSKTAFQPKRLPITEKYAKTGPGLSSRYNQNAKKGKVYWFEEKVPLNGKEDYYP